MIRDLEIEQRMSRHLAKKFLPNFLSVGKIKQKDTYIRIDFSHTKDFLANTSATICHPLDGLSNDV